MSKKKTVVITRNTFAEGQFLDAKKLEGKPQSFDESVCQALVDAGKAKWPKEKSAASKSPKAGEPIGA